ncbi:predicted protein [Naegleria gruberi]|uniref:Predicted protein n=1 Tax=Naegleria gruberi TaxID=5762 RepID=D2VN16_NAEGR|nr:uncharacterized protein NAEGRDRAFT_70338 [Naegleria gruberi]EFC41841.1 predicted protein [Naegleria gruberi]|eukprot:XP_002674585.1 predicted protein [Naegleria gruberi strain NEG-M]
MLTDFEINDENNHQDDQGYDEIIGGEDHHVRNSNETKFDNLPEEVIANICSCFMRNSTTNLAERKGQQDFSENSLFEYEDFHTVNIDDLIDIYPLSLLNRTIRNKILNNNHLWNEQMIVDLSEFSKSTKLFKYMNKINDWNYSSSDDDLIVTVERERLNIALNFLSCLGLSEYIKKLKVSCILKEVGLKESISWSKLIIHSFPNLTDIIYYSLTDRNVVKRYESLDCTQGKWQNLSSITVYFDFTSLLSLIENHKSTIKSIAFSPKMSDRKSTEELLKNPKILENVQNIIISMKFDSAMMESNKNYMEKFGALNIDCSALDIERWIPKLTHLKKLVLEGIYNPNFKIENVNFTNLTELVICLANQSELAFNNVQAPELQELSISNASIEASTEPFKNLRSLKFQTCNYDQNFWIKSHPTLMYFSLFFPEFKDTMYNRSFSLTDNQSLLVILLTSLESVSITNINPSCKLYIEKCQSIQINTSKISEIYIQSYSTASDINIKGDHCSKLHLPKGIEKCKIDLNSISEMNCYYQDNYSKILPLRAHNISLETLHISCFNIPIFIKEFLTSFKYIGTCKCVISHDHTYSKVYKNISPSSNLDTDMSSVEKIITHGDISLHTHLTNSTSLHTIISGSKLICSPNTTYLSTSLTHLETSIQNFSSQFDLPNLKNLIISHSADIEIDLSQYPHLEDFSISHSKNVKIRNTSKSMEKMKFFLLEGINSLSISIDNVQAPNIREAIIHSIKSIEPGTEPIFTLSHSPKMLFYYVSFVWKPAFKPNPPRTHQETFVTPIPNENTRNCEIL